MRRTWIPDPVGANWFRHLKLKNYKKIILLMALPVFGSAHRSWPQAHAALATSAHEQARLRLRTNMPARLAAGIGA
jgi:hypothetical protein